MPQTETQSPDTIKALRDVVGDRPLAIVGNAASLLRSDFGVAIDTHVVLRMNNGLPIDTAAQGARTDILAFSRAGRLLPPIVLDELALSIWMSPHERELNDRPSQHFYPETLWRALRGRLGDARPSVGCMTIDLVRAAGLKNVGVFGFDFKATRSFHSKKKRHGPHDYIAEKDYVLQVIDECGWTFHSAPPGKPSLWERARALFGQ